MTDGCPCSAFDPVPPASSTRCSNSIQKRIDALGLDLHGLHVVTEAATGDYACTAVVAALAGARVTAVARDTRRHGTARDAALQTLGLARLAGVREKIDVVDAITEAHLADCDILTNSGHLRPITAGMIAALPERAVIGLMFEGWEFRGEDLDLAAARERGIRIAAVNERHRDVAVFPFLGPLCLRLLQDAGFHAPGSHVAVVCDNPFAPFLRDGLAMAAAGVELAPSIAALRPNGWDAVVISLNPAENPLLGAGDFAALRAAAPRAIVAQFWGDIDRAAAAAAGVRVVPAQAPMPGHMGILLNALGHEPIVRLQTGGLRAAELIFRGAASSSEGVAHLI
ncbi:MAG: hypothetical protein QM699_08350 [Amaricoccus sp.]|uniref:hypothetical protein n=1 Tax=Amaricoccus sp. TaxID=1872485 RepID=UPI0039E23F57